MSDSNQTPTSLMEEILKKYIFLALKKNAKKMSHKEFSDYLKSINCPFFPLPKSMELAVALYKSDYYGQFVKNLPDYHQGSWIAYINKEKKRLAKYVVQHYLRSIDV